MNKLPVDNDVASHTIETENQNSLVRQAARSLKWSFLYNIVPRFVTPFSNLILAALLTPADFGLVAISTFIIALSRIVVDMGLGKTVIQRQYDVDEIASISLWLSLFISAGLYFTLWMAAPWLSVLYNNAQLIGVIRVAGLALPLTAFITIPKAILRRNMSFYSLFWINSSLLIIQAISSVILAIAGFGYWSLIIGQLIGMAISTGLAWGLAHWHPITVKNWYLIPSVLRFSIWVMVSSFQNWMFLYADNAIAGLFLGVKALGIYALGFNIATLLPGFIEAALGDVAYPSFCKLQGKTERVGQNLVKLQGLTGSILFPIAFGASAIAPPAIELLYGQKWQGLGTIIAILIIMPGLSCIWSLNENAYQSVGRPDIWTKLAGFSLLVLLPLLWIAAPYGLLIFTVIRFAGAWLLPLGNTFVGARALKIKVIDQIKAFASPLLFSAIMFTCTHIMIRLLSPFEGLTGWIKLLSTVSFGAIVYLSLIWFANRDLRDRLILSVRQVLS